MRKANNSDDKKRLRLMISNINFVALDIDTSSANILSNSKYEHLINGISISNL